MASDARSKNKRFLWLLGEQVVAIACLFFCMPAQGQLFEDFDNSYPPTLATGIVQLARQHSYSDSPAHILEIIGNAYYYFKKYDSCAYFVNLAIAKDGASVATNSYLNLIEADITTGKADIAMTALSRLIASRRSLKDTIVCLFNERLGEIYLNRKVFDSAVFFFRKSLDHCSESTEGRAYYYLGRAFASLGETDTATGMLLRAINIRGNPFSLRARVLFDSLKASEHYNYVRMPRPGFQWKMIEGGNIIYFFEDTNGWGDKVYAYINEHETTYKMLDSVFHPALPEKLVYYVYRSINNTHIRFPKGKKNNMGRNGILSCVCYENPDADDGYDMTNVLCYWSRGILPNYKARLIEIGIQSAFDLGQEDVFARGRSAVLANSKIHSVLDVWDYSPAHDKAAIINDNEFYALSGAFMWYMYQQGNMRQFISLLKDQSLENAVRTYGDDDFKPLIDRFNLLMGFN